MHGKVTNTGRLGGGGKKWYEDSVGSGMETKEKNHRVGNNLREREGIRKEKEEGEGLDR